MPPAIETRGLTKTYRSGRFGPPIRALDSLDLRVEPGEIFGFLGANGAGKTTTIKLLLRLAFPTAGEAYLLGHRIPHTPTRSPSGIGTTPRRSQSRCQQLDDLHRPLEVFQPVAAQGQHIDACREFASHDFICVPGE